MNFSAVPSVYRGHSWMPAPSRSCISSPVNTRRRKVGSITEPPHLPHCARSVVTTRDEKEPHCFQSSHNFGRARQNPWNLKRWRSKRRAWLTKLPSSQVQMHLSQNQAINSHLTTVLRRGRQWLWQRNIETIRRGRLPRPDLRP